MLTAGVALIQMPDSSACVHAMQTKDRDTCSHCPFCLLSCLPACLHVCVCVHVRVCVCARALTAPANDLLHLTHMYLALGLCVFHFGWPRPHVDVQTTTTTTALESGFLA